MTTFWISKPKKQKIVLTVNSGGKSGNIIYPDTDHPRKFLKFSKPCVLTALVEKHSLVPLCFHNRLVPSSVNTPTEFDGLTYVDFGTRYTLENVEGVSWLDNGFLVLSATWKEEKRQGLIYAHTTKNILRFFTARKHTDGKEYNHFEFERR